MQKTLARHNINHRLRFASSV